MSKELDEIAADLLRKLYPFDFTSIKDYDKDRALIRAALDEAVALERKALREIIQNMQARAWSTSAMLSRSDLLAALDAREEADVPRPGHGHHVGGESE